jgi:dynein heavy chain
MSFGPSIHTNSKVPGFINAQKHTHGGTCFHTTMRAEQVVQSVLLLTGSVEGSKRQVLEYLDVYRRYEFLWTEDKNAAYNEFLASNPDLDAFETQLARYQNLEQEIAAISPVHIVGCMSLRTQSLKYSLKAETAAWKSQYAKNLHARAKRLLDDMVKYFEDTRESLLADVQNVEEVGAMVAQLAQVRAKESDMEWDMIPIETMYYVLSKYDVRVPKEETDTLLNLRGIWRGIVQLGQDRGARLMLLQSAFKKELVKSVKGFSLECMQMCNEFDMHGPMVAGLSTAETWDRLNRFQAIWAEMDAKMCEFHQKEELFGLPLTQYVELWRIRNEMDVINQLYSLHGRTHQALGRFADLLWVNVAPSLPRMRETVSELQRELGDLPRLFINWVAYKELKQTLHDFYQALPMLVGISGQAVW